MLYCRNSSPALRFLQLCGPYLFGSLGIEKDAVRKDEFLANPSGRFTGQAPAILE